ncbi:uncharacterized protein LOC125519945 [Triticum urartu]|uniref:Uncharacterized protein n=2 Tax=Triticum TaxID=4564 RepID=A0A9R0Z6X3_TRITD|nr:uncharacterized protein LOC119334655 [Triticum dicoccoides]XP_048540682.1 uncharacterized protein LOC125519945 [Triticum urartu]VAI71394.1 unnamed protein product [Triticum turgidum subsp. durum]
METAPGSRCRRCLEILCAVLLPPLRVYLRHGFCSMRFLISVLRTIIGYYFCLLFVIQAPVMGYVRNCLTFFCVLLLVAFLNRPSNGDDDDADEDDDSATAASYVLVA